MPRPKPKPPLSKPSHSLIRLMVFFLLGSALLGGVVAYAVYRHLEPQLPDISQLQDVRYQIPMSVYSRDGKLIGQFGEKKRSPLGIAEIPRQTMQAFLAAEDDRFFEHPGVDYQGLLRAAFEFLRTGEKRQGGSTITMQVARNFFLSSEKTVFRKITEIMLAVKIEEKLSKEQILELYLNKIYFGHHAYGIEAAAQVYYGTLARPQQRAGPAAAPDATLPEPAQSDRAEHALTTARCTVGTATSSRSAPTCERTSAWCVAAPVGDPHTTATRLTKYADLGVDLELSLRESALDKALYGNAARLFGLDSNQS